MDKNNQINKKAKVRESDIIFQIKKLQIDGNNIRLLAEANAVEILYNDQILPVYIKDFYKSSSGGICIDGESDLRMLNLETEETDKLIEILDNYYVQNNFTEKITNQIYKNIVSQIDEFSEQELAGSKDKMYIVQ